MRVVTTQHAGDPGPLGVAHRVADGQETHLELVDVSRRGLRFELRVPWQAHDDRPEIVLWVGNEPAARVALEIDWPPPLSGHAGYRDLRWRATWERMDRTPAEHPDEAHDDG